MYVGNSAGTPRADFVQASFGPPVPLPLWGALKVQNQNVEDSNDSSWSYGSLWSMGFNGHMLHCVKVSSDVSNTSKFQCAAPSLFSKKDVQNTTTK